MKTAVCAARRRLLPQRTGSKTRLLPFDGLHARAAIFPCGSDRKLMGRPRYKDEPSYLLVRFARCSTCGGPVGTDLRGWGPAGARRSVPHYACLDSKRRGKAICVNRVALRQDLLDREILGAIGNALDPAVLSQAVEKALARLAKRQRAVLERRAQVERELAQVQQRLDRLIDALADGSLPADEIKSRLSTEKAAHGLTGVRSPLLTPNVPIASWVIASFPSVTPPASVSRRETWQSVSSAK
jgi:hypothetical protein